jgi:TusA-related sulfurtransferase
LAVTEKENSLKELGEKLTQKESTLNQREKEIEAKILEVGEQCAVQLLELKRNCDNIQKGHVLLIKEKNTQISLLDKELALKEAKLDGILDVLAQAPDVLSPYVKLVKSMIGLTDRKAVSHYAVAERSKDSSVSEYHYAKANKAWTINDKLKQVLVWLNG